MDKFDIASLSNMLCQRKGGDKENLSWESVAKEVTNRRWGGR
jgi:hypothetical protein